jgi:hypothetical protein
MMYTWSDLQCERDSSDATDVKDRVASNRSLFVAARHTYMFLIAERLPTSRL